MVSGVLLAFALWTAAAACSGQTNADSARFQVVATTGVLGEFARRVAGDDAEVHVLIPAGADPHSFELPTDAVRRISRAGLVLVNGYGLEGDVLEAVVENRDDKTRVVAASRGLEPLGVSGADANEERETHGHDDARVDELTFAGGDPHFWLSVPNAIRYVENIRDALAEADAPHAEAYRARAATTLEALRTLDREVRARIEQVPAERRNLVVFHDAFGYFAREYGLRLAASVTGQAAGAEPSAADVSAVVRTVRTQRIGAVYREPQFSSRALDTVAGETGARVLTLYSDAFGGGIDSYEQLMRANAEAIAEGLS